MSTPRLAEASLYCFYDHTHGLAKLGVAQRPENRFNVTDRKAFGIELVFAVNLPRSVAYRAEKVAHLAFGTAREAHPITRFPGASEWFRVSRKSVDFLYACIREFVDAATESGQPHHYIDEAHSQLLEVNVRLQGRSARRAAN